MMRKMLAATLAIGLMANGASAQVSSEEAAARKEAAAARAQAEKLAQEAKQLAAEMKAQQAAMQRKMEALERQLDAAKREAEGTRKRSNEAVEKARVEMRKALTERAAKGAATEGKKEAYIGVVTDKVPEVLSSHLGLKNGLIITQVMDDSPAGKAGLKNNDLIITMNGKAVESPEQFKKLVVSEKGGAKANFLVVRGGKKETVVVVLGEREANRLGNLFKEGEGGKTFEWKAEGPDGARFFEKSIPGVEWKAEGPGKFRVFEKAGPGGEWKVEGFGGEGGPGGGVRVFGRGRGEGGGEGGGAGGKAGGGDNNSITLNIQNNDGKITIEGTVSKDGKTTVKYKNSGTREELLKKIDGVPEPLRASVRQSLEGMGPGGQRGGGRVRVETRVRGGGGDGEGKGDNVTFVAPGDKADVKVLHAADLEKLAKDHAIHAIDGAHIKALGELKEHVLSPEHMKALKDMKVQVLSSKDGLIKELKDLKDLKIDVEALKLDELKGLEHLKELEALKDLDVQVRVLAPESIKDLKDKLPKEIEVQVEKALKEAGLKDKIKEKIKDKKVIIERSDSQ